MKFMVLQSLFGWFIILVIAYIFSESKKTIAYKTIGIALLMHGLLALTFLKLPIFKTIFLLFNQIVLVLEEATTAGTRFVFGYLGGGELPFQVTNNGALFILAFKALPLVLVMSALSYLLYYYRILPIVVGFFSLLLQKSLSISGAVGLGATANAFVGMVEAPLLIKPYLNKMQRGEIFSVMVAGMSTVAGTMMVLYAHILSPRMPDAMGHILTASVLNVISALIISLLMIPHQQTAQGSSILLPRVSHNAMDAIVKGTADGVKLLINIIAMLIVLIALVHLINQVLALLPQIADQALTLQGILSVLTAPLTFLIGIPITEISTAGVLMGTKIILNEFIAYIALAQLPEEALSERSRIIMLYAMCGFANIGSLGIMVGGMTVMAPEKRDEIIALGFKSILAGVLATCLTATVIGLILVLF